MPSQFFIEDQFPLVLFLEPGHAALLHRFQHEHLYWSISSSGLFFNSEIPLN